MTTQNWAARRTRELFAEHGITGWRVAFDNARRRAGSTEYGQKVVTLSKHFVAANTPERVEQTIIHEIAHVLAGHEAGHGPKWQRIARSLGHSGNRTYNAADTVMPTPAWSGRCGCGDTWARHRLTKKLRHASCAACRQPIVWRHRS